MKESEQERRPVPFFSHHEDALHQKTLENLWCHALEQARDSFVLDNVGQYFGESAERPPQSGRRRFRLQAYLGDDERLRDDGSKGFGQGTQN